jgi:hypothetical protein
MRSRAKNDLMIKKNIQEESRIGIHGKPIKGLQFIDDDDERVQRRNRAGA